MSCSVLFVNHGISRRWQGRHVDDVVGEKGQQREQGGFASGSLKWRPRALRYHGKKVAQVDLRKKELLKKTPSLSHRQKGRLTSKATLRSSIAAVLVPIRFGGNRESWTPENCFRAALCRAEVEGKRKFYAVGRAGGHTEKFAKAAFDSPAVHLKHGPSEWPQAKE
jgi:hypothetical protein